MLDSGRRRERAARKGPAVRPGQATDPSRGCCEHVHERASRIDSATRNAHREPAGYSSSVYSRALWLFQTKSHGRVRSTPGPMRSGAVRAKHRHQRLIRFGAYGAVSLNCANIDCGWAPLITLRSRGALWSLWALCPSLALRSRHALDALCALRARRSLRARIPLWARISTAPGKRQRHADGKYRKNPHANPPVFVSDGDGHDFSPLCPQPRDGSRGSEYVRKSHGEENPPA